MFYGYHIKPYHNLHEVFELPQGLLTLDYMVHASVIRVDVGIDVYCFVCLMEQNKCYTVYMVKPCDVCIPLTPMRTQISNIYTVR